MCDDCPKCIESNAHCPIVQVGKYPVSNLVFHVHCHEHPKIGPRVRDDRHENTLLRLAHNDLPGEGARTPAQNSQKKSAEQNGLPTHPKPRNWSKNLAEQVTKSCLSWHASKRTAVYQIHGGVTLLPGNLPLRFPEVNFGCFGGVHIPCVQGRQSHSAKGANLICLFGHD